MFIYKLTCKKNGYSYYGQTIQDPDKRFWYQQHELRRNIHANPAFQADWKKYGEKAFDYTIIDTPTAKTWGALTLLRNAYVLTDPKHYNIRLYNILSKQPGRKRVLTDEQRAAHRAQWDRNGAIRRNPEYLSRAEYLAKHKRVEKPNRAITEPWVHIKEYPSLFNKRTKRIIMGGTDLGAMCEREGFDRGKIVALIKGKQKMHKHWRIICI